MTGKGHGLETHVAHCQEVPILNGVGLPQGFPQARLHGAVFGDAEGKVVSGASEGPFAFLGIHGRETGRSAVDRTPDALGGEPGRLPRMVAVEMGQKQARLIGGFRALVDNLGKPGPIGHPQGSAIDEQHLLLVAYGIQAHVPAARIRIIRHAIARIRHPFGGGNKLVHASGARNRQNILEIHPDPFLQVLVPDALAR